MNGTYLIVVGVDGSEGSRRALRWAVREAAHRGGAVQAVLAWGWDDPDAAPPDQDGRREARERASRILTSDVAAATAGVEPAPPVSWEAVEGRAPRVLTQAAREANLLVIGSHGHGRSYHAALGAVSEECVRYAACPVVVIPVPHPGRDFPPTLPAVPSSVDITP